MIERRCIDIFVTLRYIVENAIYLNSNKDYKVTIDCVVLVIDFLCAWNRDIINHMR